MTREEKHEAILRYLNRKDDKGNIIQQEGVYVKKTTTYMVCKEIRTYFTNLFDLPSDDILKILIDNLENNRNNILSDLELKLEEKTLCWKLGCKYLQKDISDSKKSHGVYFSKSFIPILNKYKEEFGFKFNQTLLLFLICMYIK